MILTDLLGSEVFGPHFLGYVSDVRFVLDTPSTDQPTPNARLYGLVVSPHARSSSLGFERSGYGRLGRSRRSYTGAIADSFLVGWADIARLDPRRVQLRSDFVRRSSLLRPPLA